MSYSEEPKKINICGMTVYVHDHVHTLMGNQEEYDILPDTMYRHEINQMLTGFYSHFVTSKEMIPEVQLKIAKFIRKYCEKYLSPWELDRHNYLMDEIESFGKWLTDPSIAPHNRHNRRIFQLAINELKLPSYVRASIVGDENGNSVCSFRLSEKHIEFRQKIKEAGIDMWNVFRNYHGVLPDEEAVYELRLGQ